MWAVRSGFYANLIYISKLAHTSSQTRDIRLLKVSLVSETAGSIK
jgi:hypothetical protein